MRLLPVDAQIMCRPIRGTRNRGYRLACSLYRHVRRTRLFFFEEMVLFVSVLVWRMASVPHLSLPVFLYGRDERLGTLPCFLSLPVCARCQATLVLCGTQETRHVLILQGSPAERGMNILECRLLHISVLSLEFFLLGSVCLGGQLLRWLFVGYAFCLHACNV